MANYEQQPHFVLFPFMAQGHMIPMVDIARLLSRRGVVVSILITPGNGKRFETVIDRAVSSGLSIRLLHIKLPGAEAGLPEGCENFDMISSMDEALKFFKATAMLKDQVKQILQHLKPYPSCLISDMCYTWTTDVALSLGIPRLLFHGFSCFSLVCMHVLAASKDFEDVASDTEYFVVPGLPDRIEITKAQLRGTAKAIDADWIDIRNQMRESEVEALGTVANTFQELEPRYVEKYMKLKENKKLWCVGPVSLCNEDELDKAERGNRASIDEHECLKWLDSHEPSSVVYVCLGSLSRMATSQLIELGLGLEASNKPFVWVVRNASAELKEWLLEEKFEERVRERGLLIQGWAPQVLILSHPSVGGFLTHCGWNSTLEGITAGLPMMTWPVFAEQFCNEKFIVSVIKTGVRVGVELPVLFGEEEMIGVQVKSDDIKMVIHKFMNGEDEEVRERRERARKLGEMAKTATEEGGSSYHSITQLIRDIALHHADNNNHENQSANGLKLDNEKSFIVQ
ncbi:hypothetical protein ABFS82_10G044700 [Erythranthe guttata]|nr:PREDICTED: UDP-glycosyltransferase 73C3-like [Erythranthe guttata]|eukprot:XP_012831889.1 PREDICTED: UDP-glycosyltransferase 73C3-like [Erythranthe guttata]